MVCGSITSLTWIGRRKIGCVEENVVVVHNSITQAFTGRAYQFTLLQFHRDRRTDGGTSQLAGLVALGSLQLSTSGLVVFVSKQFWYSSSPSFRIGCSGSVL
jgi:hypothetical protein